MPLFEFGRDRLKNFLRMARNMTKKFDILILCEGDDDLNVLKALIKKLGIQISENVCLNNCGGISELKKFASIAATLAKLSRRLKTIVLIADADTQAVQERVHSLKQSLEAQGIKTRRLKAVSGTIYRISSKRLNFLVKVAGKMDLPFQKHEMEDYAVHLLIIKGDIKESELNNFQKSSDFIEVYNKKANTIILESQENEVKQAYENVINLLTML